MPHDAHLFLNTAHFRISDNNMRQHQRQILTTSLFLVVAVFLLTCFILTGPQLKSQVINDTKLTQAFQVYRSIKKVDKKVSITSTSSSSPEINLNVKGPATSKPIVTSATQQSQGDGDDSHQRAGDGDLNRGESEVIKYLREVKTWKRGIKYGVWDKSAYFNVFTFTNSSYNEVSSYL